MNKWIVLLLTLCSTAIAADSPYSTWKNGPPASEDYFPIAVWVQQPRNAPEYKSIGINLYVGLWAGPTEAQLTELEKVGMPVICDQRPQFADRKIIVGWMHGDEPDNAQSFGRGKGYGPPILPEKVIADYQKIKQADPTRPVLLNLGQGVAYDNYIGRGVRRGKFEDYPKYVQASDIVSFDIYPAVHDKPEIAGNLWYVPKGVSRLREWSNDQKLVWNCIETTHIDNEKTKPTPKQVKAEVWMSIIHGSRGLIYFAHQFKPKAIEAGLLADEEMSKAVGAINAQVHALAPVINAPTEPSLATVASSNTEVPIATICKKRNESIYIFSVAMRDAQTTATFSLPNLTSATVEVIDENRTLDLRDGKFTDPFAGYDVHLYRITHR